MPQKNYWTKFLSKRCLVKILGRQNSRIKLAQRLAKLLNDQGVDMALAAPIVKEPFVSIE